MFLGETLQNQGTEDAVKAKHVCHPDITVYSMRQESTPGMTHVIHKMKKSYKIVLITKRVYVSYK